MIGQVKPLEKTNTYFSEKTGLHCFEPIETVRHWFTGDTLHKANGSVCVMNLVEGEEAEVVSPKDFFKPYTVHYAETFIIPTDSTIFWKT